MYSCFTLPNTLQAGTYSNDPKTLIAEVLPPVFQRIAQCESSTQQFNPDGSVLHGVVNHADTGIFEINKTAHLKQAESMGLDINTLLGNVLYAKYLYSKNGLSDWRYSAKCWKTA